MTTINLTTGNFLKIYSNKNSNTFRKGGQLALKELNIQGVFGVVYDDFNPNMNIIKAWKKEYPEMKIFHVATRGKTLNMDSKIDFYKKMGTSNYTPDTYLSYKDIPAATQPNELFFVKEDGGTASRGVNVYKYSDLSTVNIRNSVIQKSMNDPDLYDNKRYKIRVHVLLHNREAYYSKTHFATVSNVEYNTDPNNKLREIHVVHQTQKTEFILSHIVDDYDDIEKNLILGLDDFKKFYLKEIENIGEQEFVILGFDFVVDKNKRVHIIEINHRSNYAHPVKISDKTDVLCMRDLVKLLVNGTHENTDLVLI